MQQTRCQFVHYSKGEHGCASSLASHLPEQHGLRCSSSVFVRLLRDPVGQQPADACARTVAAQTGCRRHRYVCISWWNTCKTLIPCVSPGCCGGENKTPSTSFSNGERLTGHWKHHFTFTDEIFFTLTDDTLLLQHNLWPLKWSKRTKNNTNNDVVCS